MSIVGLSSNLKLLVAMRLGVTPVPIPNTMVKTQAADGTSLETVRESRWPPNLKKKNILKIKLVLPVIRELKVSFQVSND